MRLVRLLPCITLSLALCGSALAVDAVTVDATGKVGINAVPSGTNAAFLQVNGQVTADNVLQGVSGTTIPDATTYTATAFGTWYWIPGTTNANNIAITLPTAVGNTGKTIGFRVFAAATKVYTLTPVSAQLIDGGAKQVLTKNGSVVLMSDGAGWITIGGQPSVVHVEAHNITAQSLTTNVTNLLYAVETVDTYSAWDTGTGIFTCPVPGVYAITATATLVSSNNRFIQMYLGGAINVNGSYSPGSGPMTLATTKRLASGDTVSFRVALNGGTRSAVADVNMLRITRIGN